jgi:L-amino acid N-acyltransferase
MAMTANRVPVAGAALAAPAALPASPPAAACPMPGPRAARRGNPMPIRPASEADIPAITAIFNAVIATSTAIYADDPFTEDDRRAWLAQRHAAGYPVLVADGGAGVLGLASFGDFRAWPGFRHTVEHSVHVRADARGKGLGSALVSALFEPARRLGKHVMIAGVDATNEGSIRMHERLGFARGAVLHEVGRKFGRWLDLELMHKFLDQPGAAR